MGSLFAALEGGDRSLQVKLRQWNLMFGEASWRDQWWQSVNDGGSRQCCSSSEIGSCLFTFRRSRSWSNGLGFGCHRSDLLLLLFFSVVVGMAVLESDTDWSHVPGRSSGIPCWLLGICFGMKIHAGKWVYSMDWFWFVHELVGVRTWIMSYLVGLFSYGWFGLG